MPKKQAEKMVTALKEVSRHNTKGLDIKKLQGVEGYRLRVGQYRAIYTKDMVVMTVINIGPRGNIYERR